MLILPVEQAKAGMKLVMNVTHPEQPGNDLLKAGFVLDDVVLAKLRILSVPFLYVDYPDLGELDKTLMPHLSPARQRIYLQIRNTIDSVQKSARPSVTFTDYYAATRDLVLTLMQQGQHPMYMDVLCTRLGSDEVSHATTVAQLSLTLGIRMERFLIQQRSRLHPRHASEVVNLGVAAMMHDLGKAKLPPRLQKYTEINPPEKPEDRAEWETHPRLGYLMLGQGVEPSAAAAVLHHHQHFDGSGFPALSRPLRFSKPFAEQHIHVFARIILVADLYDRLTITAEGRRRPPIEILHLLRTKYAEWVDPTILTALPSVVPPFPPGSRVTLTDGTKAVVIAMQTTKPFQPTVKRLAEDGWKLKGEAMDLSLPGAPAIKALEKLVVDQMVEPFLRRPLTPKEMLAEPAPVAAVSTANQGTESQKRVA